MPPHEHQRHTQGRKTVTPCSREVTADDLNGLRLLQLNAADLVAVLILLGVAVDGQWVPREPILHGKTADILVRILGVVLDKLHPLVLVLVLCAKGEMSAKFRSRYGGQDE